MAQLCHFDWSGGHIVPHNALQQILFPHNLLRIPRMFVDITLLTYFAIIVVLLDRTRESTETAEIKGDYWSPMSSLDKISFLAGKRVFTFS